MLAGPLCNVTRRRHEGCHASSRDNGDTEAEAVVDGTVGEGARANVASTPKGRTATLSHHCGARNEQREAAG